MRAIFEVDHQGLADAVIVDDFVTIDVALLLQDFGDAALDVAVWRAHAVVIRLVAVADPRKQISYRVSHCHLFVFFLALVSLPRPVAIGYQLLLVTPGSSPR